MLTLRQTDVQQLPELLYWQRLTLCQLPLYHTQNCIFVREQELKLLCRQDKKTETIPQNLSGLSIDLNSGTIDRALSEVGNYTVTYTFTDGTCPNTTTTTVSIDAPLAGGAGSNSPVCEGSTLSLTSPDGGATYSWTGPNGQTASVQNPRFYKCNNCLLRNMDCNYCNWLWINNFNNRHCC